MNALKLAAVSFFFLGCSPVAPGTVGTLGGVVLAWSLRTSEHYLAWSLLVCVALYGLGRALAPWAEGRTGKDPQYFVLDEVIGYLITVAWTSGPSTLTLVLGFAVFRLFDVLKPGPARRMERIPSGDGILLDDVVAGLFGLAVMASVRTLFGDAETWQWSQALSLVGLRP